MEKMKSFYIFVFIKMNLWVLVSSTKVDLNTFGDVEGNLTLQVQVLKEIKSASFSALIPLVAMILNALRYLRLVMHLVCKGEVRASSPFPAHGSGVCYLASSVLLSRIFGLSLFHPHVYL